MKRVLCFGNELHGDDGFGPAVGRRMAAMALPADCEVFEAGTRGLDAMALLEGCSVAVLVDAAAPAGHPGRLAELAVEALAQEDARAGHGQGLGYALQGWLGAAARPWPRLHLLTAEMSRSEEHTSELQSH